MQLRLLEQRSRPTSIHSCPTGILQRVTNLTTDLNTRSRWALFKNTYAAIAGTLVADPAGFHGLEVAGSQAPRSSPSDGLDGRDWPAMAFSRGGSVRGDRLERLPAPSRVLVHHLPLRLRAWRPHLAALPLF